MSIFGKICLSHGIRVARLHEKAQAAICTISHKPTGDALVEDFNRQGLRQMHRPELVPVTKLMPR